jgi:hypothetical protein
MTHSQAEMETNGGMYISHEIAWEDPSWTTGRQTGRTKEWWNGGKEEYK